jgi:hypothetical protein
MTHARKLGWFWVLRFFIALLLFVAALGGSFLVQHFVIPFSGKLHFLFVPLSLAAWFFIAKWLVLQYHVRCRVCRGNALLEIHKDLVVVVCHDCTFRENTGFAINDCVGNP